MQKRVIDHFMRSDISQKKLFAVKMLGEVCRRVTYSSASSVVGE